MKRLWRWLFNFAAVVSLCMFATVAICWRASVIKQKSTALGFPGSGRSSFSGGFLAPGILSITYRYPAPREPEMRIAEVMYQLSDAAIVQAISQNFDIAPGLKFSVQRKPVRQAGGTVGWRPSYFTARLHCAWIMSLCAVIFVPWTFSLVMAYRKRRLADVGHCQRCGYDLRATPERCPECGFIPDAPKAVAT